MAEKTEGLYPGDPKYKRLPDPALTVSEAYALLNVSAIPADSSHPLVVAARGKLDDALAQQGEVAALTPDECRELFSLLGRG